jgi:hypothetical protein
MRGRKVAKQVAAPAETRTPNLYRAMKSLIEECGWKGGDSANGFAGFLLVHDVKSEARSRGSVCPPFLRAQLLTDRSSLFYRRGSQEEKTRPTTGVSDASSPRDKTRGVSGSAVPIHANAGQVQRFWFCFPRGFHRIFATKPVRSETYKQNDCPIVNRQRIVLLGTRDGP